MNKKKPELTTEEQDIINKISILSSKSIDAVQDILISIVKATVLSIYSGENEIVIPYICKIQISHTNKYTEKGLTSVVKLKATPLEWLAHEIKSYSDDSTTKIEKYCKRNIVNTLANTLSLYDIEIEE